MAVMSFAHLKGKAPTSAPPVPVPAPKDNPAPAPTAGKVMSFAHLKSKTTPSVITQEAVVDQVTNPRLISARGIGIEKTALLASVNYCAGCPRFWPADENEVKMGVLYGRCCRSSSDGVEVWQIIPVTAKVARCWYHLQQEIEERGEEDVKG